MSSIFVNPTGVKECAEQIKSYAAKINDVLNEVSSLMSGTAVNYQSQAAEDMREKFASMKPDMDKFQAYLNKVAAYLNQNVADPTSTVSSTNVQNVANINKPQ
ncbi:MAG: WXG100 family type VII secretion target [Ruminococcus flavefaciens]|nr:WXG100 family type VII secretion target [Ruminococcus flavefaciens]